MHTVKYTRETQGQMNIHNITWSVPNIKNNTIRELRTGNSKNLTEIFQLKIRFNDNKNNTVNIYYLSPNPVFVKFTLKQWSQRENVNIILSKDYHTIDANKWQHLSGLTNYIVDYSYNLKLELNFFKYINVPETELSNDFRNLLTIGSFSDVTIKSDEGIEYKVHKAVLASRSAVLKAHFEHSTTANVLESPFESEVLNEVLNFIYSDRAPMVDEIPDKLLVAADYYQLNRLKSLCEEALHKKLTVENAVEILQLAYLHSANTLMEHSLEFIKEGYAKSITKTEEWTKISSLELIKRMYEHIVEDDVVYINIDYQGK